MNMQGTGSHTHYHHGQVDPTDYQVDDVLLCVYAGDVLELERGVLYGVHEVVQRKVGLEVVTIVTVEKNEQLIEVPYAEHHLVKTRLVVDFRTNDGGLTRHSFPSLEVYGAWCTFVGVPPDAIHYARYVRARPIPANTRFAAMCVPAAGAAESEWYVHDLANRTSESVPAGADSQAMAIELARESNRVWRAVKGVGHE